VDSGPASDLLGVAALLIASGFFAASEAALLAASWPRLRQAAARGWGPRLAGALLRHRTWILAVILIGITASNYMAERLATEAALRLHPIWLPTLTALAMAAIIIVFCEAVPLQLGARAPERVLGRGALVLAATAVVLAPIMAVCAALSRALLWLMGVRQAPQGPVSEEQLRALIDVGQAQGVLDEGERLMLHRVLDFGDLTAGQVMTPRTDLVAVEATTPLSEALAAGLESGHSRLPVYRESIDNLVGIFHLKDCLGYVRRGQMQVPVAAVARPPLFVPETLPADDLLRQLQAAGRTAAIVKDEFGGTAGLVTVEDLLEEIVGAIQDEYDLAEQPEVVQTAAGEWVGSGTANPRAIEEATGAVLPEGPWDTIGGLIIEQLQRVPRVGEAVVVAGLELTVLEMEGTRIGRVRIRQLPKDAPESSPAPGRLKDRG
jgi:putative hemolysin